MKNLKINRANIVDLEEEEEGEGEVGEEKVEEAVEKDGKEIAGKNKTKNKEMIAQLQVTQVPVQVNKKRHSKKNRETN